MFHDSINYPIQAFDSKCFYPNYKGYATRERFLQQIRQNPPNLRKNLSRNGVFNEIVIAQHAQLIRFSR